MGVLEDGRPVVVLRARRLVVARIVEPMPALEVVPTEVRAAKVLARGVVDLLPAALPDIADQDVTSTEREAKRVPQPERVDLVAAASVDERIDPQDLAEETVAILRVLARIAPEAAVASGEVEIPVRAERNGASVVVARAWVLDHDHAVARRRLRPGRRLRADAVHLDVPVGVRVVDVEELVLRVRRVECHREQAALAVGA